MPNSCDRPAIRVFWWQGGLHLEPCTVGAVAVLERLENAVKSLTDVRCVTPEDGHRTSVDGQTG
jgi:hypothetical protein